MKRKLTKKVSGTSGKGTDWFMLVFATQLVGSTLYTECTHFVTKDVYDAVEEGQEISIK